MARSEGDLLLCLALEAVRRLGYDQPSGLRVVVTVQGEAGPVRLSFEGVPPAPAGGETMQTNGEPPAPKARWLSPLEEAVVAALRGSGWLTAGELAQAAERQLTKEFRAILANLVERQILESNAQFGYRLAG